MRKIVLALVPLLFFLALPAEAQYVSNCTTISVPGYYELTNNITVSDPSMNYCIVINTSSVTLNGKGYYIKGNVSSWTGSGTAVYVETGKGIQAGNVKIENMYIDKMNLGIYVYNSTLVSISNVNILNFNNMGIALWKSDSVTVEKVMSSGGQGGIYALESSADISRSTFSFDWYGIYLWDGSNVTVRSSGIYFNGYYGILAYNSNALIYDNLFTDNSYNDIYDAGGNNLMLNTTLTYAPNRLGGAYICGNYWSRYKECVDSDANGICDSPYSVGNFTDYCPITYIFTLSSCTSITTSGTYVLDRDIEVPLDKDAQGIPVYSTCFKASSLDYFNLDCKGHTIIGLGRNYSSYALSNIVGIWDTKNVKISNCKLTDSSQSVYASNIGKLEFSNNQVYADKQTTSYGLAVECVNCNSTLIMGNKIYGANTTDFKCLTFLSSRGQISDNYIQNCYTGIYIGTSYNSFTIFNNYFSGNTKDFDRDGASCSQVWNIPRTKEINIIGGNEKGGNYWDKYTCINLDGDSFCDDAYIIDTCNKDELPLASQFTYYTGLPAVLQPFVSPYTIFMSLIGGLGVGLDFASKAGGKVLITVLVVGIMGAIFSSLFPTWTLLVFIVLAGFIIAYLIIRFIGGAV
jgi:parallel beta-helix repeat protein